MSDAASGLYQLLNSAPFMPARRSSPLRRSHPAGRRRHSCWPCLSRRAAHSMKAGACHRPVARRRSGPERLWAPARRSTAGQVPWLGEAVWWVPKSCFIACPWVVARIPPVADCGPTVLPKDESASGKVRLRSLGQTVGSPGRRRRAGSDWPTGFPSGAHGSDLQVDGRLAGGGRGRRRVATAFAAGRGNGPAKARGPCLLSPGSPRREIIQPHRGVYPPVGGGDRT